MSGPDPFGTAGARDAVLTAWTSSPTRFREDANAEEDLYLGGYRDRVLVELAQNAADAAAVAGVPGHLRVSLVDGELRVANTGAPLTAAGVTALASLRASAKTEAGAVGRFGVGFAAVLAVTDEPRVVSSSGGVAFSAAGTRAVLADTGLAGQVAERGGRVPVLRLVWPTAADEPPVPDGFATEVRLPLRSTVDANALLSSFAEQADDLLLALPGLFRLDIGDRSWSAVADGADLVLTGPDAATRWRTVRRTGELPTDVVAGLGVEAAQRPQWSICWAVRVDDDGGAMAGGPDVLHAPTPTDDRMSLPARLIATLPIEPSRRRLRPGAAADHVLAEAARVYPDLVRAVAPLSRTALVPEPDFPLSDVDERVRGLVLAELVRAVWLPAAVGADLAPTAATAVDGATDDLVTLLDDVLPGLLAAELSGTSHRTALAALDVRRLAPAGLVAAVTGIGRPPAWWRRLYAALTPLLDADPGLRADLAALPVPLADGRTLPGTRDVLLLDADDELLDALTGPDGAVLRVAHPDAVHPLLERLDARRAGAVDLLDTDRLRAAVADSVDDALSGVDTTGLVDLVLRLVEAASVRPGEHGWLGALALPDRAGDARRADELALPTAPLLAVLAEDTPIGVLADRIAEAWRPAVLTAIGVLDTFAVLEVDEPTGPEHDLADEGGWWHSLAEPPARLVAVRDLDLVADDAWPAALRLIAAEPAGWQALRAPGGYTAWWLARHARFDGRPPREWRLPAATALAGLYDPVPDTGLAAELLAAIGVRAELTAGDPAEVADLLDRLGDADRVVSAAVALRAHAAVAASGLLPKDIDPPAEVRTAAGTVAAAEDCVVADVPWVFALLTADQVVAVPFEAAESLADLLDLPLASDEITDVVSEGDLVAWRELSAVVAACELLDVEVPAGGPLMHEQLLVERDGVRAEVPWWVDADDVVHCADDPAALAAGLAWTTGTWTDRHRLTALVTDPEVLTLLG